MKNLYQKFFSHLRIPLVASFCAISTSAIAENDNRKAVTDDFVYSTDVVAGFQFGRRSVDIHASTHNEGRDARMWQFRYDPLFAPEVDLKGDIVANFSSNIPKISYLNISVALYNDIAEEAAYKSVCKAYPNEADKIARTNVKALRLASLKLDIPNLKLHFPQAELVTKEVQSSISDPSFSITISAPDETTLKQVKEWLVQSGELIQYTTSFAAQKSRRNQLTISYQDLKKSSLYVKLDGSHTKEAYVHRDDLRKLLENIHTELNMGSTVEAPEFVDKSIADKVLTSLTVKANASSELFDENKWKETYNADDLKPDVVTETSAQDKN